MGELEKLGAKYKLALRIVKDPRFERLPCMHKGTYADDCLVQRVTQHKCYIVATCDKVFACLNIVTKSEFIKWLKVWIYRRYIKKGNKHWLSCWNPIKVWKNLILVFTWSLIFSMIIFFVINGNHGKSFFIYLEYFIY